MLISGNLFCHPSEHALESLPLVVFQKVLGGERRKPFDVVSIDLRIDLDDSALQLAPRFFRLKRGRPNQEAERDIAGELATFVGTEVEHRAIPSILADRETNRGVRPSTEADADRLLPRRPVSQLSDEIRCIRATGLLKVATHTLAIPEVLRPGAGLLCPDGLRRASHDSRD